MRPKETGELSEALVLAKLLCLGYSVSIPFGNNQRYDFIIDDNGKLLKVQCKTGRIKGGAVLFSVRSSHGKIKRDYKGEIDVFVVYCPDNNKFYKIPIDEVGINLYSLRVDSLNRTEKGCNIHWGINYEI